MTMKRRVLHAVVDWWHREILGDAEPFWYRFTDDETYGTDHQDPVV